MHEDPARRGAFLARGPERPRVRGLDRTLELGVSRHDERVVAAELELNTAAAGRRLPPHGVTDRDGSREGDRADERVTNELCACCRAGSREHVEHAGRQAGFGEALGDVDARPRRLIRELEHDDVAVDERRRELPDRDRDREVPGRDQAHYADRTPQRVQPLVGNRRLVQLADRPPGLTCGVAEDRGRPRGLEPGFAQRLAHLRRHVSRDALGARLDRVRRPVQERPSLCGGERCPRRCRLVRGLDAEPSVLGAGGDEDTGHERWTPRVPLLVRLARDALAPLASHVVARGCLGRRLGHGVHTFDLVNRPPA